MNELLYKDEVFQLVGLCMEIHRGMTRIAACKITFFNSRQFA
jgi:hypothetical protein